MIRKTILLLSFSLFSFFALSAQTLTVAKGVEGKTVNREMVKNGIFVCSQEGMSYWVTRTEDGPDSFVRPDDWQVVKLDRDLNIAARLELPRTNRCEVVVVSGEQSEDGLQTVSIVLVDSSDAQKTALLSAIVEIDSMQLKGHRLDTLASYEYSKKDRCLVWGATSPNGEFVGVLSLVQYTGRKQYVAKAMMYSASLEALWGKEYAVGTMRHMAVSDRGEMVTLGEERREGEEHFLLNVLSDRSGESYEVTVNSDPVNDMQIVNVLERRVICMGTFTPTYSDPKELQIGGVVAMAFDLDSGSLEGFSMRPFENEDVNILQNKKTKKVQKEHEVQMARPLTMARAPYGAVMAVGHRHTLRFTNANGTVSTTYFAQGIHLVAVDDRGEVKWVRNFRRNDEEKESDDLMYMALFADENTVCLAKNEHKKYPGDYNIAKEAPEYELGDKGNLVLYRVSEEGEVRKDVLEKKTKHSLLSAARSGEKQVLLMTVNGNKTRMMEMMIGD